MFFISMACMEEDAKKTLKIILSIFPPVCLELGIVLLGKFESHFKDLKIREYATTYTNYSILIMNIMQIVDFFLYLFLGYYLQNVLPHDFGIKRPFYFLCTCEYWNPSGKKKNTNVKRAVNKEIDEIENELQAEKEVIKEDINEKKKKKKKKNKEGEKIQPENGEILKQKKQNTKRKKRRKKNEAKN